MLPSTDRVSESIRCFVYKVKIYQPYLVRLADVSQETASMMDNPKSDLGQFIAIQQRSPECEGFSLFIEICSNAEIPLLEDTQFDTKASSRPFINVFTFSFDGYSHLRHGSS